MYSEGAVSPIARIYGSRNQIHSGGKSDCVSHHFRHSLGKFEFLVLVTLGFVGLNVLISKAGMPTPGHIPKVPLNYISFDFS